MISGADAIAQLRAAAGPALGAWLDAHRSPVAAAVGDALSRAGAVPVRGTATTVETRLWPRVSAVLDAVRVNLSAFDTASKALTRAITNARSAQGLYEGARPDETPAMARATEQARTAYTTLRAALNELALLAQPLERWVEAARKARRLVGDHHTRFWEFQRALTTLPQLRDLSTKDNKAFTFFYDDAIDEVDRGIIKAILKTGAKVQAEVDPGALEPIRLAGYRAVLMDYRPERADDREFLEKIRAVFTDVRRKIDRYMPALNEIVDRELVFRILFGPPTTLIGFKALGWYRATDEGLYREPEIGIVAQNGKDVPKQSLEKTVIHEIAHHLYRGMPARVREDWDAFITETQPLNLRLLADTLDTFRDARCDDYTKAAKDADKRAEDATAQGDTTSALLARNSADAYRGWINDRCSLAGVGWGSIWPKLRETLPAEEFLRLEAASTDYSTYANMKWTLPDRPKGSGKRLKHITVKPAAIRALAEVGAVILAPKYPVTRYGHTNPNEAIAEALGHAIAYGPRAVLPAVFDRLQTILQRYGRLTRNPQRRARRDRTP